LTGNFIETIFEIESDFPETKIIAISGGGEGSAGSYLNTVSMVPSVKHTLQKPFAMGELLNLVKEMFQ